VAPLLFGNLEVVPRYLWYPEPAGINAWTILDPLLRRRLPNNSAARVDDLDLSKAQVKSVVQLQWWSSMRSFLERSATDASADPEQCYIRGTLATTSGSGSRLGSEAPLEQNLTAN
jgi:hypothetical protein